MEFRFLNKKFSYRRFSYSPMYYDERKERLELKKAEYDKLNAENITEDDRKRILRQNLQDSFQRSKHAQTQRSSANIRTIILILVILALGYFIFNGLDDVDVVVKKIM